MSRNFHVPSLGRAGVSSTLENLQEQGLAKDTHLWIYDFEEDIYRKEYPEMNFHVMSFPKNLTKKRNKLIDYIIESGEPGIMLDDDISHFAIGKNPNNELIKTTDFARVYDLFERVTIICPEINNLCCKRNFITTYNMEPKNIFTKFSVPSALIFFSGRPLVSRADEATKADDICFVTECWLNKELSLKFNPVYISHQFGTNAGGLQADYKDFKASTKQRLEEEHKFMVNKYNNADTYSINEKTGYFGSNGTKVKKWLVNAGYYSKEEMQALECLIKNLSEKVYSDKIFNDILASFKDTTYKYIKKGE